jgi:hypothetical protein
MIAGCKDDGVESQPEENDPQVQNSPQLVLPQNNSTTNNPEQLLQWSGLSEAVSYRIQLSTDANFITALAIDTTLGSTSLSLSSGVINTSVYYYWRVIAEYANSTFSPWSAVWRFRLILAPPPAPVLLSPANNSTNIQFSPLFDWENTPTAQYYNFQLSQSQTFTSLLLNQQQIQISEYQCPPFILEANSLYFWRVNASNSNGISIGPWSLVFSFTTVNSPEPGSISGTVRFVDTSFIPFPGYYIAGAYTQSGWPPVQQLPLRYDSLNIQYVNNQYIANYRIRALQEGDYIIAVLMYDQLSTNAVETMGVFGCDTARTLFSGCAVNNPSLVHVGTNQGVININFLTWADTSKRIFK